MGGLEKQRYDLAFPLCSSLGILVEHQSSVFGDRPLHTPPSRRRSSPS